MSTLAQELHRSTAAGPASATLSELIGERARSEGARAFIEHARSSRVLSFRDLEEAVQQWALELQGAGVAAGATVGLVIGDPLDFSAAYLGIMASGRWVAPLSPSVPPLGGGGLVAALERVQADIVYGDRGDSAGLGVKWRQVGSVPLFKGGHARSADAAVPAGAVLSSSGTTGRPKVIRLTEHQLLHTARCVSSHHRLNAADRGFNPLPLFHINAEVVGLLASLVAGASLVLDDRFHRTGFWGLMAQRRITWVNAVPAIISRLARLNADEIVPPGIRFIRSASAPLAAATLTRFEEATNIPVLETYGMTEAASQITANPLAGVRKPGSVGVPVGVELRLVAGQVEIRGPSVIATYDDGQPGDRIDGDGWLRTGDLGRLDEEGYLYLESRTDDVINRGGEKVFPREIEEEVLTDPGVAGVAVVGAPDPELGQVPVAFLVLHGVRHEADGDLAASTVARIRRHLDSALERSKRPVSMSVVAELPTGATGKLRRRDLVDGELPVILRIDCR